jgi:glutamate/tyrosine decarboxylase-like PLP-dependent enzyme
MQNRSEHTLDPDNWDDMRAQGHRMLDDIFDYMQHLDSGPVWQPAPAEVRETFKEALPTAPTDLDQVHRSFLQNILPYAIGNAHPGFMGWVQGGGTPTGMLAEMLAAGINANVGGRDQIPVEVERQVLRWVRELFRFPETASGIFVTGTSLANLIGVLVARTAALGTDARKTGLLANGTRLVAYASKAAHGCVAQAMDLSGLGLDALRSIPFNRRGEIDLDVLQSTIEHDRKNGYTPFLIVGNAGTVDTGAVDNLSALADVAKREKLWFHVDGAYGALAMMAPDIAPRLAGIERADSIAFDFHKWAQIQYDAGFILVRDGSMHYDTFASPAAYLQRETRGMAANSPWPCDFGPDLSRGFRALKTWFAIKTYGTERLGQVISGTCALARYLGKCIEEDPRLELLAPVSLSIVCFRYRGPDGTAINDAARLDRINNDIVIALQESGIAAPSTTLVDGRLAIRVALFNHRTTVSHIDAMLNAVLELGHAEITRS